MIPQTLRLFIPKDVERAVQITLPSFCCSESVFVFWDSASACSAFCARHKIITAGAGRNHTVVVTKDGSSLASGWNGIGQLGSGSAKNAYIWEKDGTKRAVEDKDDVVCLNIDKQA